MHDHIVAGCDGTDLASAAAGWAADEARRRGVSLTGATCYSAAVLNAEGISDSSLWIDEPTTLRIAAESRLDDLTERFREKGAGVPVNGCVVHGPARRHHVELFFRGWAALSSTRSMNDQG